MRVLFASKRLQDRYRESGQAVKAWGPTVGQRYIQRVNILQAADNLDALRGIPPLHLHKLSGRREGQHAINLDRRWRLLFTYEPDQNAVRVEEVSHHYGD